MSRDHPTAAIDLPEFPPGEVWLTGAGPGDPRLLTVLAVHALRTADDIVHDALIDSQVLTLAGADAQLHNVGKRAGRPSPRQPDINSLLIALARNGRRVVRLKGGDPFVFGRGGEEALALVQAGVPFRVIPGITAGLGGAALAGIPATSRDTNHAIILASGHRAVQGQAADDWKALARTGQPVVLYMAMANLEGIVAAFLLAGRDPETPAAIISAAATKAERVLDTVLGRLIADSRKEAVAAPAIVVVGANAGLRAALLAQLRGWS